MPNYSGVWDLKEQGVAVKGDRWQPPFDGVSRFLRFGGRPNDVNDIKFVTIDTKGDEVDFGDMTVGKSHLGALSNLTRSVAIGGYDGSAKTNVMDYVNPNSEGNATDFGDLSSARLYTNGLANSTRGVTGGGATDSGAQNTIEYITIGSTGNTTDFGDLTQARELLNSATSSTTRGMFFGGNT
jgi:hypothetical protein